jgi:citronellol/citronellal dehydrogenase
MEHDFTGKVAVVTGASRGIGEAIALEFARGGAAVVVTAKSTRDAPHRVFGGTIEETAETVRELGVEALAIQADVSHEEDVDQILRQTMEQMGHCDYLVNNAAVSYVGPFLELSLKRWDILMAVNLRGPMMLAQAFAPHMIERGSGHIINISSGSGRIEASTRTREVYGAARFGESGQSLGDSLLAYGTSKAALNRFTVGLAQELWGKGVAVNALDVNAVSPALRYTLPDADYSSMELPEAPAQIVTWMASQPMDVTGNLFSQGEIMPDLRAKGIVRPKVDPS